LSVFLLSCLPHWELNKEARKAGASEKWPWRKNLEDIHFAVVRSQLKAVDRKHGLLLNFAKTTLEPKRVIAF